MYHQYMEDRTLFFSEGNLENILKDVIPIGSMSDKDIEIMLDKRTQKFPEVLPEDVKELVIEFADGNPREALLVCQNALLSKKVGKTYTKEDFILTIDEIKDEMEKFIETCIDSLKLSSREKEVSKIISNESVLSRAEILRLVLKKSKIPKSTLRETIEKLIEKKALLEVPKDLYQVGRKIKLHYKYFER